MFNMLSLKRQSHGAVAYHNQTQGTKSRRKLEGGKMTHKYKKPGANVSVRSPFQGIGRQENEQDVVDQVINRARSAVDAIKENTQFKSLLKQTYQEWSRSQRAAPRRGSRLHCRGYRLRRNFSSLVFSNSRRRL